MTIQTLKSAPSLFQFTELLQLIKRERANHLLEQFPEIETEARLEQVLHSESLKKFAGLFPCRFQWGLGEGHCYSGRIDSWVRSRGKLNDRELLSNWEDPSSFIGVSFDSDTQYFVIDIDAGSPHWWNRRAIEQALEPIGINYINWYKSSGSGGFHGYVVFDEKVSSFWGAVAIKKALLDVGLELKDGELELFPNVRAWNSLYKIHRLPCQAGFGATVDRFLADWEIGAEENDLHLFKLSTVVVQPWLRKYRVNLVRSVKGRASQLYHDLQEVITTGWTSAGETNFIIGRIAYFHRVFSLEAETVEDLAKLIEETVLNSPGFYQYSNHQADLKQRAKDWAKCAWKKLSPYGSNPAKRNQKKPIDQNLDFIRSLRTRSNIAQALLKLKNESINLTQRIIAAAVGCSQFLISKHRDLLSFSADQLSQLISDAATFFSDSNLPSSVEPALEQELELEQSGDGAREKISFLGWAKGAHLISDGISNQANFNPFAQPQETNILKSNSLYKKAPTKIEEEDNPFFDNQEQANNIWTPNKIGTNNDTAMATPLLPKLRSVSSTLICRLLKSKEKKIT